MIISKSPAGKYMLGIDLSDTFCQISYLYNKPARLGRGYVNGATGTVIREPVTYSMEAGQEAYNIPAILCRHRESGSWLAGLEALEAAEAGKGAALTGLLDKARKKEMVSLEGDVYSAVALLAIFLRRCLAMLEPEVAPEQVACICVTAAAMDYEMEQALLGAFDRMEYGIQQVKCESHQESFFSYMLMQDADQRRAGMLLCEYDREGNAVFSTLLHNRRTTPVVFWANRKEAFLSPEVTGAERDHAFAAAAQEVLLSHEASSVYLTGEGFEGGWLNDAAAFLCRGRRVFAGENLFSKGACYSALLLADRPSGIPETIFLAEDTLRSNIGIEILIREQMGYHVLLDAGTKWYNAEVEEDFILENGKEFTLLETPVTGAEPREWTIRLDGLPDRPDRATRLRVVIGMPSPGRMRVQIRDLGFGDIFPSEGGIWEETFPV